MSQSFTKDKKKFIILLSVYIVLTVLLLVSLVFSRQLEPLLYLKPDLTMINDNALEVHFVDVGQGDSILIRFPSDETMLIDAGRPESSSKLMTYIDKVFFKNGENTFNYVVLTHADSDHCGSMPDIIDKYDIQTFFRPSTTSTIIEGRQDGLTYQESKVYSEVIKRINAKRSAGLMDVIINSEGNNFESGNVSVRFVAPIKQDYKDLNNVSPFILISYQGKRILLTGDAEDIAEKDVINKAAKNDLDLDVDVLKLGHHGSKTSTCMEFLEYVRPEYAIISVGLNNVYNHPSPETMENLLNYSKDLYNNTYQTSLKGNIICYVQDSSLGFTFIKNAADYMFIDYYVLVIVAIGAVWVVLFTPSIIVIKKSKAHTNKKSRSKNKK